MEFKIKIKVTNAELNKFTDRNGKDVEFTTVKFLSPEGDQYECTYRGDLTVDQLNNIALQEVTAEMQISNYNNRLKLRIVEITK